MAVYECMRCGHRITPDMPEYGGLSTTAAYDMKVGPCTSCQTIDRQAKVRSKRVQVFKRTGGLAQ